MYLLYTEKKIGNLTLRVQVRVSTGRTRTRHELLYLCYPPKVRILYVNERVRQHNSNGNSNKTNFNEYEEKLKNSRDK